MKAADVVESFHKAAQLHGLPYSLLSDNGAVFTGASRRGKVLLETELERLGVIFKNSRPYHPQTCGKVERLHQTLKRYLHKQPPAENAPRAPSPARHLRPLLQPHPPPQSPRRPNAATGLQRPHQSPDQPASSPTTHFRVREDKVDKTGRVTLRYNSRLYHIGIGRAHKGRPVKLLIADRDIRIIDLNGQLLRELTLDPSRDYQPLTAT